MARHNLQTLALLSWAVLGLSQSSNYTTPAVFPSPNTTGLGGWAAALAEANDFISNLNLTEKAYLVTGVTGPCVGNIGPILRLGFNGLCLQDGPLAIRQADYASVFPAGLSAAASWDIGLIQQRGLEMGSEFKAKGANIALGPVAGPLGRSALGGRNWEGFSPDPYLTGIAFATTISAMQAVGLQSCAKHFIGYEQETQRNPSTTPGGTTIESVSSNIDDRTMHELYLWPFADAVRAGVSSIMCSYNRINGTYACQNSKTINGLLKEELGFQGYVMSDWGGTHAGLASVEAGLDMDMPGGLSFTGGLDSYFGQNITTALNNGSLSETRLNDMIARIMTPYFYLQQNSTYPTVDPSSGALNNFLPSEDTQFQFALNGTTNRDVRDDHATLIRNLGAASAVLLKNTNGTLPLKAPKNIGVFGNDAADLTTGLYNTANLGYLGFETGALAIGGGSGAGRLSYIVPPLDAIKARAAQDGALVQYITDNSVASNSISEIYPVPEVCLVFLKTFVTEGLDRISYLADWNSSAVVSTVTAMCNNTIVVTHSGGINVLPWADNPNVTAIIAAHLPGQEIGNSIVDVLYGAVNPSGHLPYTIAYNGSDYNAPITNVTITDSTSPNAFQSDFTEGLLIDYRHFDTANITPRYEFGFGLSYTTFDLSNLTIDNVYGGSLTPLPPTVPTQPGGNPTLYDVIFHATCTVSNTGSVPGAAVPQLYLSLPSSAPTGTPVRVLRGFAKVSLDVGGNTQVGFDLMRKDISYWDVVAQDWRIPAGEMTVQLGFSSRDLRANGTVTALQ